MFVSILVLRAADTNNIAPNKSADTNKNGSLAPVNDVGKTSEFLAIVYR